MDKSLIINKIKDHYNFKSDADFARKIGITPQNLSHWYARKTFDPHKLAISFPEISTDWLLTGKGSILKEDINKESNASYIGNEITPIDRTGGVFMDMRQVNVDWFKEATNALRHTDERMQEYPQGCILALKELEDRNLFVPGKDYVIVTKEYRITQKIQKGKDEEHITLYSTNTKTHKDGRLIYEPFELHWKYIYKMYLILGYIVTH